MKLKNLTKTILAAGLCALAMLAPMKARATGPYLTNSPLFCTAVTGTSNYVNSPTNPAVTSPTGGSYMKMDEKANGVGRLIITEHNPFGMPRNTPGVAWANGGPSTNKLLFDYTSDRTTWTTAGSGGVVGSALSVTTTNYGNETNVYTIDFTNASATGVIWSGVETSGTNNIDIDKITLVQPRP